MPYSQEGRLISLTTPLGTDKLLLAGFSGQEAISRLFSFRLDLLHQPEKDEPPIDFTQIVGQSVTIRVIQSDDTFRYFNGVVSHFALTGIEGVFTRYEMHIVPALWTLTRYANCRIFHNKDVKEIIRSVFSARGFSDFSINAPDSYPTLEYCVQYRETDFNFVSRLMEQFGLFYYFEHGDGTHTMKILDSAASVSECPKQKRARFDLVTGGLDAEDVVTTWTVEQEWKSGKITQNDYNFKTPAANLETGDFTPDSVSGNSSFEIYDYPGEYGIVDDGKFLAKRRMEEEEAGIMIARGSSVCRAFTTGYKFELAEHPIDDLNKSFILTEIQHVASVAGSYGLGSIGKDSYSNHFACVRDNVKYRPARLSPKPFVQGPQTAVVVTSSDGEEIWVDKYGRVLVKFFWDRESEYSCWVRVSQDWAGQGWGMINIPRVGQEVIVSFLEGNPDRPLITGRVYNEIQVVPYELPANGTRTTFKTHSSKGGGDDNYNELRFEDKKGKEQVFVRAEFDQDNYVKNDSREWIGENRSLVVTKDQMDSVGGDYHEEITGKNFIKIGGDRNEQVAGKEIIKIGGNRNEQVGGNEVIKIGGDRNENVGGNHSEKIGSTFSLQVGQNLYEKSGMNYAHQAGMAIHLKAGMNVVIEAGVELTLKAGGSFIDIGPAGIAISGAPLVMINSGGAAGSGCGSSPVSPTDPVAPADPKDPDLADDGKSGTKRGSGGASTAGSSGGAGAAGGSAAAAGAGGSAAGAGGSAAAAGGSAAAALAGKAEQTAQQATQEAVQAANQAAQTAQQAADQAQQEAQQAVQQAQQAVDQVKQQARQAYQQATQAVQQAVQAVNQASAQAQAQAQQALSQAQQFAQQTGQQAAQAVQQAEQQAQQVQQQAQQAAQQAQQAAQQAQEQAQQAAQDAKQAAQQAAQQAQQQAQQAVQQGQQAVQQAQQTAKQAAQQAQQQAQQAAQQAQQAAQQAQYQAQQATQQAQQAAQQVQQSATQSLQQAQQSAQQAQQSAQQAISQAGHGI